MTENTRTARRGAALWALALAGCLMMTVFLAGCQTVRYDVDDPKDYNYEQEKFTWNDLKFYDRETGNVICYGMPREEVDAFAGEPYKTSSRDTIDIVEYQNIKVCYRDNLVCYAAIGSRFANTDRYMTFRGATVLSSPDDVVEMYGPKFFSEDYRAEYALLPNEPGDSSPFYRVLEYGWFGKGHDERDQGFTITIRYEEDYGTVFYSFGDNFRDLLLANAGAPLSSPEPSAAPEDNTQ